MQVLRPRQMLLWGVYCFLSLSGERTFYRGLEQSIMGARRQRAIGPVRRAPEIALATGGAPTGQCRTRIHHSGRVNRSYIPVH